MTAHFTFAFRLYTVYSNLRPVRKVFQPTYIFFIIFLLLQYYVVSGTYIGSIKLQENKRICPSIKQLQLKKIAAAAAFVFTTGIFLFLAHPAHLNLFRSSLK